MKGKEEEGQKKEGEGKTIKEEEQKIKVGEKEYTSVELAAELEKNKNLESEYTKKYIDLTNTQKELEPLIELQQYLAQNPEKAAEIAKILQDEEKKDKEKSFETDIPEVKKLKEEIDELKKSVSEGQAQVDYEKQVKEHEVFFRSEMEKLSKKYNDLDEEVFIAKLMSIPNLNQAKKTELVVFMDKLAEDIDKRVKDKKTKYVQEYLSKKEKDEQETKGEGAGGQTGGKKEEIKDVRISDGSAKAKAIEFLNKLKR